MDWSSLAFKLDLQSIPRQIVINCVVSKYSEKSLQLTHLSDLDVMLKPEIKIEIKQAIEQELGVSLKLDFISAAKLETETPYQADLRIQEEKRQQVIREIQQDPVVQQLKTSFGAQLIESSVQKRVKASD